MYPDSILDIGYIVMNETDKTPCGQSDLHVPVEENDQEAKLMTCLV